MSALGRSKFSDFVVKAVLISFALAGLALGAENPLGEVMTNSDDAITDSFSAWLARVLVLMEAPVKVFIDIGV